MDGPDIVCAGAVVHDDRRRLLLVQRGTAPAIGRWSIPGGRVEAGEALEQACVREVLEETGLTIEAGGLLGTVRREAPSGGTYVIHDFEGTVAAGSAADPQPGDDAVDARWVTLAELLDLETVDGLVEALRDWDSLPR